MSSKSLIDDNDILAWSFIFPLAKSDTYSTNLPTNHYNTLVHSWLSILCSGQKRTKRIICLRFSQIIKSNYKLIKRHNPFERKLWRDENFLAFMNCAASVDNSIKSNKTFLFHSKYTYLTALLSDIITLLLMLELRLVHCFDDADTLSSDRFFLLHKSSLFS